jgi:peptide/nickel transport system ATP-binding protein
MSNDTTHVHAGEASRRATLVISLRDVVGTYTTVRGTVNAVDGVSLDIAGGGIIGVAGESGCGKTTLLKLLYGNLEFPLSLTRGNIRFQLDGMPIAYETIRDHWFDRIAYIPQSSMSSLNPVIRIRNQFLDLQGGVQGWKQQQETLQRVRQYLTELELPVEVLDSFPHQLSGGMRQRVMVALATFFHPDIILADEPTTALDVVVQKGILLLLAEVQEALKNTIFIVTHDMGVHYQLTHRMLIMYAAKIVEYGPTEEVFSGPRHPYTRMLIESLPKVGDDRVRQGAEGKPPSLYSELRGCRFAPRCPKAQAVCREKEPELAELSLGRKAACFFPEE